MARNNVQFQKGLGLAEFNKLYGTGDPRHRGSVPRGPGDNALAGRVRVSAIQRPRPCFLQAASTLPMPRLPQVDVRTRRNDLPQVAHAAGVVAKHASGMTWFLAMHLITSAKNDIASLELLHHLDVKWDTAWLIKQKLLEVMLQRNSIYTLAGDIQIDDAYQDGEKPAIPGKSGRAPHAVGMTGARQAPFRHHRRDAEGQARLHAVATDFGVLNAPPEPGAPATMASSRPAAYASLASRVGSSTPITTAPVFDCLVSRS